MTDPCAVSTYEDEDGDWAWWCRAHGRGDGGFEDEGSASDDSMNYTKTKNDD